MEYFNENYEMKPHGINGGLHTAYYMFLEHLIPEEFESAINTGMIRKCIEFTLFSDQHLSHDNMTGALCLSKLYRLNYEDKTFYRQWRSRLHPRDIWFYNYMRGGLWSLLVFPLGIVFFIDGFLSVLNSGLAKNGVLNTTGKLLAWLRCQAMIQSGSKLFAAWFRLLSWILRRSGATWADIFEIYFTVRIFDPDNLDIQIGEDKSHPTIALSRSIYG